MKTLTLDEFHAACTEQAPDSNLHVVVKCPMCATLQMGQDFIDAGAGSNADQVMKYVGFSCIGRFTGAGSPRAKPDGAPCNWTLGGLFKTHKMEVVTPDGQTHPHFELASNAEALAYREQRAALALKASKAAPQVASLPLMHHPV